MLCPIPYTPIIIGVGLNYRKHAEEAGVSSHKPMFSMAWEVYSSDSFQSQNILSPLQNMPVGTFSSYIRNCRSELICEDSLAGPYEDIPISKDAPQLDFEVR